ncbi:hypothetical protein HDV00_001518 [Rhizophlyctis rosea]|nr:hypothetical protein HDV00_001518 [Rhizophlyctis rosea]
MPKIVSSSTVSASTDGVQPNQQKLHTYYCSYCGEFVLIIDKHLRKLPRRKTDNAYIVDRQKHTSKINLATGPVKLLRRPNGYERQNRYLCQRCALPVAYDQRGQYLYILDKAAHVSVGGAGGDGDADTGGRETVYEGRAANKSAAPMQKTAEQFLAEIAESMRD